LARDFIIVGARSHRRWCAISSQLARDCIAVGARLHRVPHKSRVKDAR